MRIEYTEELPPIAEYKALFETTGWNKFYKASIDELHNALSNSWYTLSAYESGQLVGFGRVLSDGVLYAMVYDLIVSPLSQRNGIGSEILNHIIDKCREAGIREVQLFSAARKSDFYRKRGFIVRPQNAPGMQLRKK